MIVLIDNYDSFTYNLYQAITIIYPDVQVVRNNQRTVKEIEAMQPKAIIISPGPGRPEEAGIGVELVQKLGHSVPILGVCLGHQIIVMAYGGSVVLAKKPVHGKSTLIFHLGQDCYKDMSLPFQAARYHSLIAEKQNLPKTLVIEASNDQGVIMGVRHRDHPVYGVQFHPESILTPEGDQFIRNFLNQVACYHHVN